MKVLATTLALSVSAAALVAASPSASVAGPVEPTSAISAIQRASTSSGGAQVDSDCYYPVLSSDGNKVLFVTDGTTLMSGGGRSHVYMKTLSTGLLKRVSSTASGIAGNNASWGRPAFSPDGTKVVFASSASNLVAGDTNAAADIFEKNLITGAIRRLSTSSTGQQADGDSRDPHYSPDGRKVIFASDAKNLVASDTNGFTDLFVKDLTTGKTQRVSLTHDHKQLDAAAENPAYSTDGKKIAFASAATNLVPGDTNATPDIFVRTLATGTVQRANLAKSGAQSNGWDNDVSLFHPNGSELVFTSRGTNLIAGDTNASSDVFAKNLTTGAVRRLSTSRSGHQLSGDSDQMALDGSGTVLVFVTFALDALTDGRPPATRPAAVPNGEVIVKNFAKGTTVRASTSLAGVRGNAVSYDATISADGKRVAFTSWASNLVPGDTNGYADVFVVTLK